MNVGFIGLGRMGDPMARALLRAGFPLTVHNRTPDRALLLGQAGATVAESPAEVAAASDVVIMMLANDAAVRAVTTGGDGVLTQPRRNAVLIDMSTVGPDTTRAIGERAAAAGMSMLDAPVSGSVPAAESATLTTLVGGSRAVFDRARPVLAAMTRTQIWLGPAGAGAAMKLAVNGMLAVTNQAIAEALAIAERSGITREAAYQAIGASAVNSPFVAYKREAFLAPDETPVAFTLALMQKDLTRLLELARAVQVPVAAAAAADQMLSMARALMGDDRDLATVSEALRQTGDRQAHLGIST